MRRHRTAALALAAALLTGLVGPQPAPAAQRRFAITRTEHVVNTRFGKIYVLVSHPTRNGRAVRAPAIFTYSPYSDLGTPPNYRRNNDERFWVRRGYARVWADVVGTGNSGGCWDYGGRREKVTGHQLVEWIAHRRWSTGKVGMIGGSYEGTTATATAVTNPRHLTTIVPEAAISRWYGYAFSGGIRYFWTNEALGHEGAGAAADEGFDTPLAFDFGLAIPPPLDVTGPGWADRVTSTITPCDELTHTRHGYDQTPDYTRFWRERDYLRHAHRIDIPVLVAHNWGDWNVKQEEGTNLFQALRNSPNASLYMGTRWEGHGTPPGKAYRRTVARWFAHYLKGSRNGIAGMPAVTSQRSSYTGPGKYYRGPWPDVRRVTLYAQATPRMASGYRWKLMPRRPRPRLAPGARASFPSTGTNTETEAAQHPRLNQAWFRFETPRLARNLRIFGHMKVQIYSSVQRRWITFTPSVFDVSPRAQETIAGQNLVTDPKQLVAVTRGWLDSRYRYGLSRRRGITPGERFPMTVRTKPQDYTFGKGHVIGLNIQTEIDDWSVPKPYPGCDGGCQLVHIDWKHARTRLVLPVVNAPRRDSMLFRR